jgi:hypothetical protein
VAMSIGNRCPDREICIALSVARAVASPLDAVGFHVGPLGVRDASVCNGLVLLGSVCFRPNCTRNA